MTIKRRRRTKTQSTGKFSLRMHHFHPFSKKIKSGRLPLASFKMRKGAAVAEWLSSWLAEQEVRGSIPRLATWISEIGYLPLPSRDMAEIPLKRRKSSIQPTKSRWEKLSHVTPYIKGKLQIHVPSTSALLSPKINLKCQKKKLARSQLNCFRLQHLHPVFFRIISRGPVLPFCKENFPPTPLPPFCIEIAVSQVKYTIGP